MKILRLSFLLFFINTTLNGQSLEEDYIAKWKVFYPSKALSSGMHTSVFLYENRSASAIKDWLEFNKKNQAQIADELSQSTAYDRINLRLLKVQVQSEIDEWETKAPQTNSVTMYSSLISNALRSLIDTDFLTNREKGSLLCERMKAIQKLCLDAELQLKSITKSEAKRSLDQLTGTSTFISEELTKVAESLDKCEGFELLQQEALKRIQTMITHIEVNLLPQARDAETLMGRKEYARRLALYTDSNLTPDGLSKIALEEIKRVKELMLEVSRQHLINTYPSPALPKTADLILEAALADMQNDVPTSGADYLKFWQELSTAATDFLEKEQIATIPKNQTLRIMPAPESAGPAARIGWVDSAPPFAPNPMTTLYLPSIPETLPKQEQIDFWASFNKPFNRIIVIHELFPGHYMQLKISRETPHPIRLLFPYGVYIEGWATFCERVALDNGWEKGNHLSMLAHLRKRLENANRAYTSMQVHCNNWNKEQVMDFSTKTSLVAPQFAKSLWGRIMRSPMQLTSYFLGGTQFTELLESEKNRLGDKFDLRFFMDTIMKTGPVPIDEFSQIFNPTAGK